MNAVAVSSRFLCARIVSWKEWRMVSFVAEKGSWLPVDDQYDYHREVARAAFADMLHDDERNRLYKRALGKAIAAVRSSGRPVRVLDIGTGTGLLAMMAAQMGADSIVACEAFEPMADCAAKIIEKNGFANKIKLIPKRSTDIIVGKDGDMECRANVLVTEVFDTELIGEGAIETFRHAHSALLEKDCIVVPDSATVYAQIVECPTLQRWNKLKNVVDSENLIILETPSQITSCPGSAAVHDIQLSQLPRSSFREMTKPIPVFQFDWSGKKTLEKKESFKFSKTSLVTGFAQMVFMWWDLKMDTDGEIILSCAPYWHHPDVDFNRKNPEESIPWRDHWMQAIYYFPEPKSVHQGDIITLYSSHDEFSMWFYMVHESFDDKIELKHPVCECGVHMILSRTHVSYMNDTDKNNKFIKALKEKINSESVCLCLNGASLIGLLSAKMGAKRVFYVEPGIINKKILDNYIKTNNLSDSVTVVSDLDSALHYKSDINLIINDPHFANAILPWDNIQFGYNISKLAPFLNSGETKIIPGSCSFWFITVEFLDLHKIKKPLGICEDIDLTIFDDLIKNSRNKSDDEIEVQPLWEYPCICRLAPTKIGDINFNQKLKKPISSTGSMRCDINGSVNGIVFWIEWNLNENSNKIGTGPLKTPEINKKVEWDPSVRQAVKIFEEHVEQRKEDTLKYSFFFNPDSCAISVDAYYIKDS